MNPHYDLPQSSGRDSFPSALAALGHLLHPPEIAIYHVYYLVMSYKPETSTNCELVTGGIIWGHNNTFHMGISAYSLPSSQIQSRQGCLALSSFTDQRQLQLQNKFLLRRCRPCLTNSLFIKSLI